MCGGRLWAATQRKHSSARSSQIADSVRWIQSGNPLGPFSGVVKLSVQASQMTPSKAWEIISCGRDPSAAILQNDGDRGGSGTHRCGMQRSAVNQIRGTLGAGEDATGGLTRQPGNTFRASATVARSREGRRSGGSTMPGRSSDDNSSDGGDSDGSNGYSGQQRTLNAMLNRSQSHQTDSAQQALTVAEHKQHKSLEKARRQRLKRREGRSFRRQCWAIKKKEARGEEAYNVVQGRHSTPSTNQDKHQQSRTRIQIEQQM